MLRPSLPRLAAAATGTLLTFAAPAAATPVKLGPSLTSLETYGTCFSIEDCAYVYRSLPEQFVDRAPYDGVITAWSVQGLGWFQIFPAKYSADESRILRRKASTIRYADSTSRVSTFPARTLIEQGDAIGMHVHQGSNVAFNGGFKDNLFDAIIPAPLSGQTVAVTEQRKGRIAFQATIEPDGDEDGYGDDTQDLCPTKGTTVGPCDAPPQPPAPPEPEVPAPKPPTPPVPPAPVPPAPVDVTPPGFRSAPKVLIERNKVRFRVDLTEPAKVYIAIRRQGRGPAHRVLVTRQATAGKNGLRVRKRRLLRAGKRRLGPGRYRAFLHPVDAAGHAGAGAVVRFRLR